MPDDDTLNKKSKESDLTVQGFSSEVIKDVELTTPEELKEIGVPEKPATDFWDTTIKELRTLWRNRGKKRRLSAYNVYLRTCFPEKDPDVSTTEHMKSCNLSWKELLDTEKAKYQDLADKENEESK